MFIISEKQLRDFDLTNAKQFVQYWGKPYSYASVKDYNTKKDIDYIEELNLGNSLSGQNIKRLLRWKDPRMLTEKILSGPNEGKDNLKVLKVLDKRNSINRFRKGNMGAEEFKTTTEKIFPNGFVWQIFLFHIADHLSFPLQIEMFFILFQFIKKQLHQEIGKGIKTILITFFKLLCLQVALPKGRKGMNQISKR